MASEELSLFDLQYVLKRDPEAYKLDAYMRAFMRVRSKDLLPLTKTLDVAFRLHRCQDKQLRQILRAFVINDIKRINLKHKSPKQNSVYSPAVRFFLGQDKLPNEKDSDSESDEEVNKESKIRQLKLAHRVGNKTKKRDKRLERSVKNVDKTSKRKAKKENNSIGANFAALNLLRDTQSFAERLFSKLQRCGDRFEIRLILLDLITRLVGLNKLLLLNLYPFLQRFLRPQQREITHLLLFTAQASHDQIPPDVMEPVVRTIADNFITERASSEAIAVGLNAVREICARCPYACGPDLLSDLIQYTSYRNKNVVAAARSLIRLYRQLNPAALPKKERGKPTEQQAELLTSNHYSNEVALEFGGRSSFNSMVPGSEALVLAELKAAQKDKDAELVNDDDGQEEKSNTDEAAVKNDSNDEWASCSESDDDDENSDSDDEFDEEEVEIDDLEDGDVTNESTIADTNDAKSESASLTHKCNSSDKKQAVTDSNSNNTSVATTVNNPVNNVAKAAADLASSRIFTQEEFEAMRRYQEGKRKRFAKSTNQQLAAMLEDFNADSSGGEEVSEDESAGAGQLVQMSNITRLVKRPKQSKAERLESIEDGRAGREKYGYKVQRMNPKASTTNKEKRKHKAFGMIKHKVKQKTKRSFREKQQALRDHLKKMVKHMRT